MTALLDGHQDLMVFPEEYLYFKQRKKRPLLSAGNHAVLQSMFKDKTLFRLQGKESYLEGMHEEGRDYRGFDYQRFSDEMDACFRLILDNEKGDSARPVTALALIALILSFSRVTGKERSSRWVIKHPHYELHWQQLFSDFPTAKLIYMVRNPGDVILSRTIKEEKRKYLIRGGSPADWKKERPLLRPSIRYLQEWEQSINSFHLADKAFPGQVLKVRYEDLVSSPQQVMQGVSKFLAVDWSETLLTPSFLGNPFKGGSMQGQSYDGINAAKKKKSHSFSSHRLWQIEAWLGNLIVEEPGRYALSELLEKTDLRALMSWLPGEGPVAFVQNRVRMISNQQNCRVARTQGQKPGRGR